jgi:hypothetical protein
LLHFLSQLAPFSLAGEAGLCFCRFRGGPSGTLRERFARRLLKLAGLLGTVRGSFRPVEAGTSPLQT